MDKKRQRDKGEDTQENAEEKPTLLLKPFAERRGMSQNGEEAERRRLCCRVNKSVRGEIDFFPLTLKEFYLCKAHKGKVSMNKTR